ncbi:hypothetical protein LZ198_02595 [Myxococcus sp. K15C18031901]|uniref:hypothetical protein n=1 Tax=Myxococcus dinghuensis TaxID=2906761 RepID=UPI0020A8235D|nr:hypothetical protein [Myxococcus dinghuensis]MCP3097761.1 hypothetical protein [Myxococcus dinghuensis]
MRWADAEERLQGTLYPALPRTGQPAMLSLHVGAFEGEEFTGPLTLTVHLEGAPDQLTRTLTRDGVNWHTELVLEEPGLYELEVRYQARRLKVVTGQLTVAAQPLPPWLGWGLVVVGAGAVLALGVRGAVRRLRPVEPPPRDALPSQEVVAPAAPVTGDATPSGPATPEAATAAPATGNTAPDEAPAPPADATSNR